MLGRLFRSVEQSWEEQGRRSGRPRLAARANIALGHEAVIAEARAEIGAYYDDPEVAGYMLSGLLTTPAAVRAAVSG